MTNPEKIKHILLSEIERMTRIASVITMLCRHK